MDIQALLNGASSGAIRAAMAIAASVQSVPVSDMTDGLRALGQRADQGTLYGGQMVEGYRAQDHFRIQGEGKDARYFTEVAASFGEPVVRWDGQNSRYYVEVLRMTADAIDMYRLQGRAPWLLNHWGYDIEANQKGRIHAGELRTGDDGVPFLWIRVELSRTANNADYRQNVQDGIYFGASVGYRYNLDDVDMYQTEDGVWIYEIKRWQPYEVSNVSIPAGAQSGLRSAVTNTRQQENPMPDITNPGGAGDSQRQDPVTQTPAQSEEALRNAVTTAQADATTAERARIADINSLGAALGVPAETTARAISEGTAFVEFARTARAAETQEQRQDALNPQLRLQPQAIRHNTNAEGEMQAREDAYVARALRLRPGATDEQTNGVGAISADARQFMEQTPSDIALAVGNIRGDRSIETHRRAHDITMHALNNYVRSGVSTADYPAFLGGALQRVVLGGFNRMAERLTYRDFVFEMTAANMNEFEVMYPGAFYGVEGVPEWGKLPEMTMAENSAKLRAEKRGGRFGVSLESIINDNFGLLDSAALDMGMAMSRDEQYIAEIALKNGIRNDTKTGRKSIYDKAVGTLLDPAVLDDGGRLLDAMMMAISAQTEPNVKRGAKAQVLGMQGTTLLYSRDLEAQVMRLNGTIQATSTGQINIHQNRYKLVKLLHADPGTLYMMDDADMAKIVSLVRVAGWQGIRVRPILVPDGLSAEWGALNIVGTGVAKDRGIVKVPVTLPPYPAAA